MNNNFISSSEYAIRSGRVRFSWKEKKVEDQFLNPLE